MALSGLLPFAQGEVMLHVIDDEEFVRELIEIIIADAGYRVLCFESGNQYLEYLDSPQFEKPIAVLTDVTMPGINGYDLAIEIRKKYPLQKIVLISGNADDEHHVRAARQLCYTLSKPFQPPTLEKLIHALAACEKAHASGRKTEYFPQCEFGIDHSCPLHEVNRLN